jgi:hypothetical protein
MILINSPSSKEVLASTTGVFSSTLFSVEVSHPAKNTVPNHKITASHNTRFFIIVWHRK